ncbi:hypothetical protein B4R02_26860, partial [Salmonella enterica subsp. diarizonae serovar 42:l,v:1,5,7]|nr:hypothetical protein [Salmonella enterica subsp. diarizonae serovar 42:l,v:1,5,7]
MCNKLIYMLGLAAFLSFPVTSMAVTKHITDCANMNGKPGQSGHRGTEKCKNGGNGGDGVSDINNGNGGNGGDGW